MLRKTNLLLVLGILAAGLVLAACGGTVVAEEPIPVDIGGGIGDSPIPVESDGGIGDSPIPVDIGGGIGDSGDEPADSPLVTIQLEGGMCMIEQEGQTCGSRIEILNDGSYTATINSIHEFSGQLDEETLVGLRAAISGADLPAIKAVPFEDTCPIAYDGQEYIYTFHLGGGATEEIASCTSVVDPAVEPFASLEPIIAEILSQPLE